MFNAQLYESSGLIQVYPPTPTRKPQEVKREKEPKKPVIKKPLNAFMLYMKEMRAKVIAECTLKESAAINQILGRRVSDAHANNNPAHIQLNSD